MERRNGIDQLLYRSHVRKPSDFVGIKSGLALSRPRIVEIFADHDSIARYTNAPDEDRLRSATESNFRIFEEAVDRPEPG